MLLIKKAGVKLAIAAIAAFIILVGCGRKGPPVAPRPTDKEQPSKATSVTEKPAEAADEETSP